MVRHRYLESMCGADVVYYFYRSPFCTTFFKKIFKSTHDKLHLYIVTHSVTHSKTTEKCKMSHNSQRERTDSVPWGDDVFFECITDDCSNSIAGEEKLYLPFPIEAVVFKTLSDAYKTLYWGTVQSPHNFYGTWNAHCSYFKVFNHSIFAECTAVASLVCSWHSAHARGKHWEDLTSKE